MLELFLCRGVTGLSRRYLTECQELAEAFGLDRVPDESILSRTWRKRFNEGVQEFIETAARLPGKEIRDGDLPVPTVRPEGEVVTPGEDGTTCCNGTGRLNGRIHEYRDL